MSEDETDEVDTALDDAPEVKEAGVVESLGLPPGIYPDLDWNSYARVDAINFSILSMFKDTPAHAHWVLTHEPRETPALRKGHIIHRALLEPDVYDSDYVVRPPFRKNTKAGKLAHQAFEARNRGKEFITKDEAALVEAVRLSVSQHATAREYLYGKGASELVVVWEDPETKVLCKSRIDRLVVSGTTVVVLDVKTEGDVASIRNWERAVVNYAYAEQAAMYLEGLNVLTPRQDPRRFVWLVVEKEPPNLVRLFDADSDALDYGYKLFREHLSRYAECKAAGVWPAYAEGVETVGLPPWVHKVFTASL